MCELSGQRQRLGDDEEREEPEEKEFERKYRTTVDLHAMNID